MKLDILDSRARRFRFGIGGESVSTRNPEEIPWWRVAECADRPLAFLAHVIGRADLRVSSAQLSALCRAWRDHHGLPDQPAMHRLFRLLSSYGDAIEADLQAQYGIDLAKEWRARRWRKLLNLIDHLPRDSHYIDALASDEEAAAAYLDAGIEEPEAAAERFSDWSPEREALERVVDRLGYLIQAVVASSGSKPPHIPVGARPESTVSRLRRERDQAAHLTKHRHVADVLLGRI